MQSDGTYQSFDVSSRVALVIGPALDYVSYSHRRPTASSIYDHLYCTLEALVGELVGTATVPPDTYTYCESTTLLVL